MDSLERNYLSSTSSSDVGVKVQNAGVRFADHGSRGEFRASSESRRVGVGHRVASPGLHLLHLTISQRSNKLDDVHYAFISSEPDIPSVEYCNFQLFTCHDWPINLDDSEHENANRSWRERPCPAVTRRMGTAHGSTRPWTVPCWNPDVRTIRFPDLGLVGLAEIQLTCQFFSCKIIDYDLSTVLFCKYFLAL